MLKFLLIVFVLFFVFGKIIKYALKYWVLTTVQKQQNYTNQAKSNARKEGSIHVENNQSKNSNKKSSAGDYIDYEIVK